MLEIPLVILFLKLIPSLELLHDHLAVCGLNCTHNINTFINTKPILLGNNLKICSIKFNKHHCLRNHHSRCTGCSAARSNAMHSGRRCPARPDGDIRPEAILSTSFGSLRTAIHRQVTCTCQIWIPGWILPHFDVRTISVASKLKKLQIFLYY